MHVDCVCPNIGLLLWGVMTYDIFLTSERSKSGYSAKTCPLHGIHGQGASDSNTASFKPQLSMPMQSYKHISNSLHFMVTISPKTTNSIPVQLHKQFLFM